MKRREFITPLGSAASKTYATEQKEEVKKDDPEIPPDSPPIDLWDDAVKKLIRGAKKRGYVTHDQVNALVLSGKVQSEQIGDILVMFSEMGVNVVETKEAESPALAWGYLAPAHSGKAWRRKSGRPLDHQRS